MAFAALSLKLKIGRHGKKTIHIHKYHKDSNKENHKTIFIKYIYQSYIQKINDKPLIFNQSIINQVL